MNSLIRTIDVHHRGHPRAIAVFKLGDVLIDCGPGSTVATLLEALGDERPRVLALTHIHLDHAGAAGALVERFPELEVWVHDRGAPHLVDPSKLMASATRLYGDDMDRLWGTMIPVPAENVRVLHGGEQLGGLEVAYTPGHASHHVSYRHPLTDTVFAGDVAGVRIPPSDYILPPTPPPDIDLERWQESIARLRAWSPQHLAVTHFGTFDDVGPHLDRISRGLEVVAQRARTMTLEQFTVAAGEDVAAAGDAETVRAYTLGAPPDQTYAGLVRYWSKRDAAAQ